jgi:hypothetical protein
MSRGERHGLVAGLEKMLRIAAQDIHRQPTSSILRAGDAPREKRNTPRSHRR